MTAREKQCRLAGLLLVFGVIWPAAASAIPVFARVYGKPCAACHTIFPQLNPAGEQFRAQGLHGMEPVIKPLRVVDGIDVPGTIPAAIAVGVGEDVSRTHVPGRDTPTNTHFNLEYLAVLAGGEIGQHLAFLFDYAPLFSIPQTGDLKDNTRIGLGFLQAHAKPDGWLVNLRAGLFELPLGTSPRVHRLSVQPYLLYNLTAFSLLGRRPPVTAGRTDTLNLSSTQIGGELSALSSRNGGSVALGVVAGSNNRKDNNAEKDVYIRLGQGFGLHKAGFFFYYSPNVLGQGPDDWALRLGPDVNLYWRQVSVRAQFLAGYDSNPTGHHVDLWYCGFFTEGEYRWTPTLASLARVEYAGTPTFDDRPEGGTTYIRRRVWQITAGSQWLVRQNVKMVAEATYGANDEAVSNRTSNSWLVTVRLQTAFWPFTPPGLEWLGQQLPL